jgi:hypothetical protein
LPTGEKDDVNQIIPFLKFLFILALSISRVSSSISRELQIFKLFDFIFTERVIKIMRALKSESGCFFVSVQDWMIVWEKFGLVCIVGRLCGWVWGMVKIIFFRLGKCSKSFVNTSFFADSTGMSTASFVSKPSIISQLNLACQIISNQLTNFYISTSIMLSLTIYLAL